ncbi:hypothetical protein [Compostimonas suwonensis]|nr:hypothetical protein [Compostimonas suwonensis]
MDIARSEELLERPIADDTELEARVAELIGRAIRRQLWMLFLDGEDRQLPLIMPMDDYPSSPAGGRAELFASRIGEVLEAAGAARVIFVWERPYGPDPTPVDRVWAHALAEACEAEGVAVRAQLLSHRSGVRLLAPEEYA